MGPIDMLVNNKLVARGEVVLVDRRGAPGAVERLAAACELAQAAGADAVLGPLGRDSRCGCALTKRAKALYAQVHLPTTKDSNRPVLNCRTAW